MVRVEFNTKKLTLATHSISNCLKVRMMKMGTNLVRASKDYIFLTSKSQDDLNFFKVHPDEEWL